MKKYLSIVFALVAKFSFAQTYNVETPFFGQLYENYLQNPIFFYHLPMQNFTQSSLFLNREEGNFRLGQEKSAQTDFGIRTKGYFQYKNLVFYGDFNIQRIYQDEKKWNISMYEVQPNGIMPSPHYKSVQRGAKWNAQQYNLKGGIIFPILPNWNAEISAVYNLVEKYRYELDPRAKINSPDIGFNFASSYKIKQHNISAGFRWKQFKDYTTIEISDNNTHIPSNYYKYERWLLGYGTMQNIIKNNTRSVEDMLAYNIGYQHITENTNLFVWVSYSQKNMTNFSNSDLGEKDILAKYTTDELSARVSYLQNLSSDRKFLLTLMGNQFSRDNFLQNQQGKNYIAKSNEYKAIASLLKETNKRTFYDVGLSVSYNDAYQKDALSNTITDHSHLQILPYTSQEFVFDKISLIPTISLGYEHTLSNSLINQNIDYYKTIQDTDFAAKTLKLFYDEVVYPDYEYFNTNKYVLKLSGDIKYPISPNKTLLTGIASTYKSSLKGNDRYFLSLHFTLNY
ncbi:MAG: hypothetical protein Q3983_01920 [Capnocytophaga sp.]|nr:hypothetical protein [Capnocytophaga sp.]